MSESIAHNREASSEYILEMNDITKIFPGVKALDSVHFNLKAGEIHALVGENGAGKSTFIKTLTGVHQPDGGEIILNGEKVVMTDPIAAQERGIGGLGIYLVRNIMDTVEYRYENGRNILTMVKNI